MPHRVALRCKGRSVVRWAAAFTKIAPRPAMNSIPGQHWALPIRPVIVHVCAMACARCPSCSNPLNQLEQIGVGRFKLGQTGHLQVVTNLFQVNAQSANAGQLCMC